jgi:hypothetical protein
VHSMAQVMIGLSARDYHTTNEVWKMAKHHLNPAVRRRIGWRGRSSFLRQLILYGFERASADPAGFFRDVRDTHDPLIGRKGRVDEGAERRQAMVADWEAFFPRAPNGARAHVRKVAG